MTQQSDDAAVLSAIATMKSVQSYLREFCREASDSKMTRVAQCEYDKLTIAIKELKKRFNLTNL